MKISSIQQSNQSFRGSLVNSAGKFIGKHPGFFAGLAASSVVAQKIVMSTSEITIAPLVDIGVGKVITKVADEKDDRTMQSSKVQAVRTVSQSIGGTITGVIIRSLAIAGCTALFMKAGKDAGSKIGKIVTENNKFSDKINSYEYAENIAKWGKTAGGALAIIIMMVTNFLIDAPLINKINKKMTEFFHPKGKSKEVQAQAPVENKVEKEGA